MLSYLVIINGGGGTFYFKFIVKTIIYIQILRQNISETGIKWVYV